MPCLNLSTNVNLEGVDISAILKEATSVVAKHTGKPESILCAKRRNRNNEIRGVMRYALDGIEGRSMYVMIVLKGSVPLSFGGTEDPAAYGELVSIGGLNAQVNKEISAAIATILETKLKIPKTRYFLKFYDSKGYNFGWNGSVF